MYWDDLIPLAEIKQINVDLASQDPFGQLAGGFIRLLCHIRPCHNRLAVRQPSRFVLEWERFDAGYDDDGKRVVRECWFCLFAYRECCDPCSDEDISTMSWKYGSMIGLILELVDNAPNTYRRIGLFCHPWRRGSLKPGVKDCPEFADVKDPSILERQEITII